MDASLHLSLPLSSVSSPPPSAPSLRFVARRSRSQAPNRSRNICTGSGGGWGAGGERPVRALIRDERVMSLTNKPSRYERFFWIAWRPMSWFLLSPRFDATDARPFLSTRPPLARRSLFTTVFKFFQFYLPRVRFIPCLFTRYTALFASSLIQKFCLLSYIAYIRYPMYFEGYIYIRFLLLAVWLLSHGWNPKLNDIGARIKEVVAIRLGRKYEIYGFIWFCESYWYYQG